jgi:hypothetical protein
VKAEEYAVRTDTLNGWPIRLVSYRLEQRWFCAVDNVDPGACIARAEGDSRDEVERLAAYKAAGRLARTRRQ